jgi:hypothetical protein
VAAVDAVVAVGALVAADVAVAPAAPVALLAARLSVTAASAEARRLPIARQSRRYYWPGSIIDPANSCVCMSCVGALGGSPTANNFRIDQKMPVERI